MPRLFTAIDLPDRQVDSLIALRTSDLSARWTPATQIHMTIRFVGDASEDDTATLRSKLRALDLPAFELSGGWLDVFPSRRKPRVLVVRMRTPDALQSLREAVDRAVVDTGFRTEDRPFRPHVTIGRLKNASPREVRRYLKNRESPSLEPFEVRSFQLYSSTLTPEGAEHTVIESYALERRP